MADCLDRIEKANGLCDPASRVGKAIEYRLHRTNEEAVNPRTFLEKGFTLLYECSPALKDAMLLQETTQSCVRQMLRMNVKYARFTDV